MLSLLTCNYNTEDKPLWHSNNEGRYSRVSQLMGLSITEKCDVYAFGGVMTELFREKHRRKNISQRSFKTVWVKLTSMFAGITGGSAVCIKTSPWHT